MTSPPFIVREWLRPPSGWVLAITEYPTEPQDLRWTAFLWAPLQLEKPMGEVRLARHQPGQANDELRDLLRSLEGCKTEDEAWPVLDRWEKRSREESNDFS